MGAFKLFSWGDDDKPPAQVDQSSAVTAESSPASQGNVSSRLVDAARQNAEAELRTRRARKPRTDAPSSASTASAAAIVDAELARQLDALHSPKLWGALLAAPGDVALSLTGREYWDIKKDEREILGESGSAAARALMITNPRALALAMLGSALLAVYLPRIMKEANVQREKQAKKEEEERGRQPT